MTTTNNDNSITHALFTESDGYCGIGKLGYIVDAIIDNISIEQLPSRPLAGWGCFDGPDQPEYKIRYCSWTFSLPYGVTLDDLKAQLNKPIDWSND